MGGGALKRKSRSFARDGSFQNLRDDSSPSSCPMTLLQLLGLRHRRSQRPIAWQPAVGLGAIKTLTSLSTLNLSFCTNVATEGLRAVSSITSLTLLYLWDCENVTEEGLRALSSLTALDTLYLNDCENVSDAGMQALGTALPKLTIHEQ